MHPVMQRIQIALNNLQSKLSFQGWYEYPQFATRQGLGRNVLIAMVLGILWGFHASLALWNMFLLWNTNTDTLIIEDNGDNHNLYIFWTLERIQLLLQWSIYVVIVCTFHLSEFFVTAVYNPTVTNSDSFLVNHSTAYTIAFLSSWMEFSVRFLILPFMNSITIFSIGLIVVIIAQCIRSVAMATCGASFNHLIQTQKKDDHVLITHGIYKYLRHPSYFGFYYWSVATQFVLCNPINGILYAGASCMFFRRRIPYEEESLQCHFPNGEYIEYASKTWIGIPFVQSLISTQGKNTNSTTTRNGNNNNSNNDDNNKRE